MTQSRIQSSPNSANDRRVSVTITYLEQRERPSLAVPAMPAGKIALLRAEEPPLHFYRYLYRVVGENWHWQSRRLLNDEALAKIIHDPRVYIYVLYINGAPAGFAEIDSREPQVAEIKFFGLAPEFSGNGLSRYFLTNIVDTAWSLSPETVRLETCTLDHPAALPLYQKFGFRVYDRRDGIVDLID